MEDNNDSDFPHFYSNFTNVLNIAGRAGDEISIIELRVPVETQMEYFKFSNKIREDNLHIDPDTVDACIRRLNDADTPDENKKPLLSALALSRSVKAYRFLEEFRAAQVGGSLNDWAGMALMECRIALESELLDEKRIYISTGLGGRDNLLRYQVIMIAENETPFLPFQRDMIERDMPLGLSAAGCEVERITVSDIYFEMLMLAPVSANIREALSDAAAECNNYGNFISPKVTVTNIRELSDQEIRQMISRSSTGEGDYSQINFPSPDDE
jgi:hypothetical protein